MSQIEDRLPWINVVNVNVLDNPTSATNPFQFEIIFEACQDLEEGLLLVCLVDNLDLEWKLTYVGDYRSTEGDQILDSVLVGPITRGTHKFCFQVRIVLSVVFNSRGVDGSSRFVASSCRLSSGSDGDSHHLLLPITGVHPNWVLRV